MKIIYIDRGRFPTEKAHGYQIAKMCEVFASLGCDVELLAPGRTNLIKADLFEYYGLRKNFKVKRIALVDFFDYFKTSYSLNFYLVSIQFFIRLFFMGFENDSVIYSRAPEIIWLFILRGFRTVFEAHNWPKSKEKIHIFFIKKASKIIALTNGLKEIFLEKKISRKNILVSPDGVDLEIFDIRSEQDEIRKSLGLPLGIKIIGYTGSFTTMGEDKGMKDIIASMGLLLKIRQDIVFIAVGGNEQDIKYYANIAKKNGVFEKVRFIPRKSLETLARYQKACDIMLMPFPDTTHYRHYMSPLKMFEYMASKRPIIASDLPSVRDVLNEKNCIFCKPDNPQDLADKIIFLFDNPEIAERISQQAFEDAKKYTWQKRAEEIIKFIA
jgi:glycosyltransferase involved in cell wall biosynthesis